MSRTQQMPATFELDGKEFPVLEAVILTRRPWCRATKTGERITIDRLRAGDRVLTFGPAEDFDDEIICLDDRGEVHFINERCIDIKRDEDRPLTLRESLMAEVAQSFDDFDSRVDLYRSSLQFLSSLRSDVRVCESCEQILPIDSFVRRGVTSDGTQRWSKFCAPCFGDRYRRRATSA